MAIKYSAVPVYLREVVFREMPSHLLEVSPKGTVPVLVLESGKVIDESLDIMYWALEKNDPDSWRLPSKTDEVLQLIETNDQQFKYHLDRYKYSDRYPENTPEYYREKGELFLQQLNSRLETTTYLVNDRLSTADIAIFPFVRQFAYVDKAWFDATLYEELKRWLNKLLESSLFESIMEKYPQWQPGDEPQIF